MPNVGWEGELFGQKTLAELSVCPLLLTLIRPLRGHLLPSLGEGWRVSGIARSYFPSTCSAQLGAFSSPFKNGITVRANSGAMNAS
jgi:hypothetical protein